LPLFTRRQLIPTAAPGKKANALPERELNYPLYVIDVNGFIKTGGKAAKAKSAKSWHCLPHLSLELPLDSGVSKWHIFNKISHL
jgi:hypothetical protein